MAVGALVQHVGQVLDRAHALFGGPHPDVGVSLTRDGGLARAEEPLRRTRRQMGGLTGVLPARHATFVHDAVRVMDATTRSDTRLRGKVSEAGRADGAGWARSGAVLERAATDTAGFAPVAATPAGQRALIAALRARVAEQQRLVNAYKARDARLAVALRSLVYGGAGRTRSLAGGGFGGGRAPLSQLPGLSGLAHPGHGGSLNPPAALVDWRRPGQAGPDPGLGAATAALSRLGCPYVWGAKGPSRFDCSGLTQWAWRQVGVPLGGDTYAQISAGVAVPPGQVRAGDLIFPLDAFGEGGRSGPGHVQLAISDHQVVHAPTSGDVVRIAPLPARYIARRPAPMALA